MPLTALINIDRKMTTEFDNVKINMMISIGTTMVK